MNVNLHIERLVLEGLPIGNRDAALVQAAVQAELTRLWSQPTAPSPQSGAAVPMLRGAAIAVDAMASPLRLGGTIAQSIYGAIAK